MWKFHMSLCIISKIPNITNTTKSSWVWTEPLFQSNPPGKRQHPNDSKKCMIFMNSPDDTTFPRQVTTALIFLVVCPAKTTSGRSSKVGLLEGMSQTEMRFLGSPFQFLLLGYDLVFTSAGRSCPVEDNCYNVSSDNIVILPILTLRWAPNENNQ